MAAVTRLTLPPVKQLVRLLTWNELEKVHQLWDEMAEFSPSESDQAQLFLLQTLGRWIGADNTRWHAGVRILPGRAAKGDGMHGWRLQGTRVLQPRSPQRIKMAQGYHRVQPGFEIGMPVRALSAEAGNRFRVHLMRDGFIDFKAFSQTEYYQQYYRNLGIADRLWICFPLNREIESIIVFDRHEPHGHFTRKQAAWAATVWHGLRWFHRQLVLSHGILGAQSSLSPGQRRLVQELLTGKTEKEIAATLGQSAATTHQYVKAILRHFGVNSRASLMALWLGAR
ncbi:MAG TPA: LuxR C-terminal-related transcriptional regulator [Verrucomicrobiae bacterium]